jgi:signal transduction histidine kinase
VKIRSFRDLSIRSKLTALGVLTSATALVLACAAFVTYDVVTFREASVRKLSRQAEMVGFNSAAAIIFRDPEAAEKTLEAFRAEPQIVAAGIYGLDGTLFAGYARSAAEKSAPFEKLAPRPEYGARFSGEHLSLLQPIVFDGDTIGSVALQCEMQEVRERATRYAGIALVVLVVSFGVAILISSWPRRIISTPILELVDVARVVSEKKDYSVRAVRRGRDELGLLVDTFNEMLSQIEKRSLDLQEARDSALEASRLKSAFLANMSHEIRTPLNIILGYNNLIADHLSAQGDETQIDFLETIRRAANRLIDTIDGILNISRIETHTFDVRPIRIELAPLIERQVHDLQVLAAAKALPLLCEIEERGAAVLFDEYCLSQALVNLIQNAIKFTERGEVVVRLYRDAGRLLCVSVRDTGVGIDPDYAPKLFQPFSQEEVGYTRRFEGTGLGLALTKRYLELNAASISVRSEKGRGAVFTISFSPGSERAAAVDVPAPAPTPPPATSSDGVATVLVVEDHDDSRAYLKQVLGKYYDVLEAASADEVRARLAVRPDVRMILMDLSLKGHEDGLTITRELRKSERWRDVPIIATTAHAFPQDRARALEAGCTRFVAKPINHLVLLATMKSLLH